MTDAELERIYAKAKRLARRPRHKRMERTNEDRWWVLLSMGFVATFLTYLLVVLLPR